MENVGNDLTAETESDYIHFILKIALTYFVYFGNKQLLSQSMSIECLKNNNNVSNNALNEQFFLQTLNEHTEFHIKNFGLQIGSLAKFYGTQRKKHRNLSTALNWLSDRLQISNCC